MSYVTQIELQNTLEKSLTKQTEDILEVFQNFMSHVDDRFNGVEHETIDLKKSHDRLLNSIDVFIGRIDRYETEQLMRDTQFERLLTWARKVSEKTGIPLESF